MTLRLEEYPFGYAQFSEGGLAEMNSPTGIVSRTAQGATVPAGRFVGWHPGDPDRTVRLPSSIGEVQITGAGVVLFTAINAVAQTAYAAGDQLSVVRRGRIQVRVEENVDPTSPVYVRFATGPTGLAALGGFRASSDSGTAALVVAARFTTTAFAGDLAVLDLNL